MPKKYSLQKFQKEFQGYTGEYDIVLDTDLVINNNKCGQLIEKGEHISPEVYFDFLGRKIRWINKNRKNYAILVIPFKGNDPKSVNECVEIANKLISVLVRRHGQPIIKKFDCARGKISLCPLASPQVNYGGTIPYNIEEYDEKKWISLSLFKEAINSNSIFYSYLSFYKILELIFNGDDRKIKEWTNKTVNENDNFKEWRKGVVTQTRTAYSILYGTCRTASAHALGVNKKVVNPDKLEDIQQIQSNLEIIKILTNLALKVFFRL